LLVTPVQAIGLIGYVPFVPAALATAAVGT